VADLILRSQQALALSLHDEGVALSEQQTSYIGYYTRRAEPHPFEMHYAQTTFETGRKSTPVDKEQHLWHFSQYQLY
jgi:hypothetical protein